MRVAIIGAGFSGLATCWHLLSHQTAEFPIKVIVFDPGGIGSGCSGIAAGLLHTYAGLHAKLNWGGEEGIAATKVLLREASLALGQEVARENSILRPAQNNTQEHDFRKCAAQYSDTEWLPPNHVHLQHSALSPHIIGALLVHNGYTVNCSLYLQGLWKACQAKGAMLQQSKVNNLTDLNNYDAIIIATGAAINAFPELSHLPITPIKGQVLEYSWPKELPTSILPLNSQAYLIKNENSKSCVIGATFERKFSNELPDPKTARTDLEPKIFPILPSLQHSELISCKAGIRASTPDHLPLIGHINKRYWFITGMGSKGLLYHALFAKKLVKQFLTSFEKAHVLQQQN